MNAFSFQIIREGNCQLLTAFKEGFFLVQKVHKELIHIIQTQLKTLLRICYIRTEIEEIQWLLDPLTTLKSQMFHQLSSELVGDRFLFRKEREAYEDLIEEPLHRPIQCRG